MVFLMWNVLQMDQLDECLSSQSGCNQCHPCYPLFHGKFENQQLSNKDYQTILIMHETFHHLISLTLCFMNRVCMFQKVRFTYCYPLPEFDMDPHTVCVLLQELPGLLLCESEKQKKYCKRTSCYKCGLKVRQT